MYFARLRCALICVLVLFAENAPATEPHAAAPFRLSFNHFDHHWFQWTPKDPKIEAIEALATDLPDGKSSVVIFTTDRAAPKHQTFYVDDPRTAAAGFGIYREMTFEQFGDVGFARGMHVRFSDDANRLIDWSMTFPKRTPLRDSSERLANQIGHDASRILILFLRGEDAAAETNALHAGAANYTLSHADISKLPFPPAYSSNVFVGTLAYGETTIALRPGQIDIGGETFSAPPGRPADFISAAYPGQSRTLAFDERGGLKKVDLESNGHHLTVSFEPALLVNETAMKATFVVSFDAFENRLRGIACTLPDGDRSQIRLHVDSPDWASKQTFESTISPAHGAYAMTLSRDRSVTEPGC